MNIKNNYNGRPIDNEDEKILLANGQTGIIKSINVYNNSMIVEIEGRKFNFEYGDICNLRLAYCFTVHKAQGSTYDEVLIDLDSFNSCWDKDVAARLLYVAVSRAKHRVLFFGSLPKRFGELV